ncbi:MAG: adenosine kinase [Treponema sp.]|nr:adenosine kinase [Treponema sp.]
MILCIGNALVDLFAQGEEQFVLRHGISRQVQHIEIEKLKAIISELPEAAMVSGGGAANVAKIASLLGAKAYFAGALGNDQYGQVFEKELGAAGVKLRLSLKPSPTGLCLYFKAAGKTYIAASPSAALELSENDINGEDIQKAAFVVIDGFMLPRPDLVKHILQLAEKYEKVAALDLSSVFIARDYAAEILDYAKRYPLILFMNEAETIAFNEGLEERSLAPIVPDINSVNSASSARIIPEPGVPIIVVKLGSKGALCFSGGEIHRAETQAVEPLENTGAGDAFCAGFLFAYLQGKGLDECAALGNRTAAGVLNVTGTKLTRI